MKRTDVMDVILDGPRVQVPVECLAREIGYTTPLPPPCLEPLEVRPGEVRPSASATQPLPPPLAHGVAEPRDRRRVPGDPVVAVVAAEFPGSCRADDQRSKMLP